MAKFCTKCGKKLEEGEVCNCTKKTTKKAVKKEEVVQEEPVVTPTAVATAPVNDYLNQYLEVARGIFTRPVDTIKKFAKSENFTLGLIMIAINCLVTILFIYLVVKEFAFNLGSMTFNLNVSRSYYTEVSLSLEDVIKLFVMGAGGFATTAMMLYVMASPVFKTKADIKQLFSLVGVCSVFTTVTTLVALVCLYLSVNIMFIILMVCGLAYLIHLYHGFLSITEVEKNKIGYAFIASISVSVFVVLYLLPKILF